MSVQPNKGSGDILNGLIDGGHAKPQPKRKRGRPRKAPVVPDSPEQWAERKSEAEMERMNREWLIVSNDLIWTRL